MSILTGEADELEAVLEGDELAEALLVWGELELLPHAAMASAAARPTRMLSPRVCAPVRVTIFLLPSVQRGLKLKTPNNGKPSSSDDTGRMGPMLQHFGGR